MKNIFFNTKIFVSTLVMSFTLYGSQAEQEITIKDAKPKHLGSIQELTKIIFFTDLKPIIEKGCSDNPIVQAGHTDAILNEWLIKRKEDYEMSIDPKDPLKKLLIAQDKNKQLLGICNFEKHDTADGTKRSYVSFMAVASVARKQGIGTKLLTKAQTAWDDVKHCELTTLDKANELTQQFYKNRGFTNKGPITIDERAPESHRLYSKEILE